MSSFLITLLLLSTIAAATAAATATPAATAPTCNCYEEKTTQLLFYAHEITAGPNATVRTIVPPPNNYTYFGGLSVFDDPVTLGPQLTSEHIGRTQGLSAGTSMVGPTMFRPGTVVFTSGPYNGSTLDFSGLLDPNMPIELIVTGGTGYFRMARGYAVITILSSSQPDETIFRAQAVIRHC